MHFRSQNRSNSLFANVLTKTNGTMVKLEERSRTQSEMMSDLTLFPQYVIVLVAVVLAFMLWHLYMASWEDYDDNTRAAYRDYEDWVDEYEEWADTFEDDGRETTPMLRRYEGPLSPDEVLRLSNLLNDETDKLLRSIKEQPLSRDEVSRLTKVIRAADIESDYGTILSRKRKNAEDTDESDDQWLDSPRTRKLKIETKFGADGVWVCGNFTRSPSVMSSNGGYSADCEVPFTFRASHPGRAIKSPVKMRK
ncbi:MAG: hypothetical protein Q9172_004611 [Xanthocarpia lactea]